MIVHWHRSGRTTSSARTTSTPPPAERRARGWTCASSGGWAAQELLSTAASGLSKQHDGSARVPSPQDQSPHGGAVRVAPPPRTAPPLRAPQMGPSPPAWQWTPPPAAPTSGRTASTQGRSSVSRGYLSENLKPGRLPAPNNFSPSRVGASRRRPVQHSGVPGVGRPLRRQALLLQRPGGAVQALLHSPGTALPMYIVYCIASQCSEAARPFPPGLLQRHRWTCSRPAGRGLSRFLRITNT
jgi:hypothetical protein